MKKISILFLSLFVLASCSKDDDNDNGTAKSGSKAMTAFVFAAADNEALTEDVKATIDEEEKKVTAEIPAGRDVTSLKPTITISEGAKVSPGNKEAKDFSEVVAYKVTAEDGTETKYDVTLTIGKFDAKAITSFEFLKEDNDGLSEDVEAEIDEAEKTILARVPFGTDVTALKPSIGIPGKAEMSPGNKEPVDFSKAITYTVTAEDGTKAGYTVEVEVLRGDRQVLVELYNANQVTNLGWELDGNMTDWKGVTVENGRVVELKISRALIDTLPPSIGDMTRLRSVVLAGNRLASVPAEIGKLQNLKFLYLDINLLTSIPDEIGQLVNLEALAFTSNQIKELPSSLGNLANLRDLAAGSNEFTLLGSWIGNLRMLESLELSDTKLEALPPEIGNLTGLEVLKLSGNSLTSFPSWIGNLTGLEVLDLSANSLTSVPSEIGNLTKLVSLFLHDNSLTNLPASMGNLTNLNRLWIQNNQITQIPREICALDLEVFSKDDTAICEE